MAANLIIPGENLERVASANTDLLDVVRNLAALAKDTTDQTVASQLYAQIDKLLGTSESIAKAVKSAVTQPR